MIEEQLDKDKLLISGTKGDSMLPFLRGGTDKVIISKDKTINKYDVVLYKNNENKNVLHRVIDIKDNNYYLRGDNTIVTETICKDDILGVLVGYYHINEYVDINDEINYKAYLKSKRSLPLRILKNKIRNILK